MALTALDRLPLEDKETGDLTVVVETPRGSRNKFTYDPACGVIRLGAVLAEGLVFPYDFGFLPSTLGEDGDPLDVLLLLDTAVPPGCVVTGRLIGVIEVEQKEKGRPWLRNDRFLAVATHAHSHLALTELAGLRPHLLQEIDAFFVHYAGMNGKTLRILRHGGPRQAHRRLRAGVRAFRKRG
jgi:inorganic pyrophosphatase